MPVVLETIQTNIVSFGRCWECGTPVYGDQAIYDQSKLKGRKFFCINGHGAVFTETVQQKLDEANRKRASAEEEARIAKLEADRARKKELEAKLEAKRLATRSANGVCPCCHRQFKALHRHMKIKHPDYAKK